MKAFFLILIVICCHQLHAQEMIGAKIPVAGNERYIVYPRNKANSVLYDTTNRFSFCNLLQTAVYTTVRVDNLEMRGIDPAHRHHFRSCDSDLRFHLGPQSRYPIRDVSGKDSIVFLADGTVEYVYPARDSIFFINRYFDDFVLREQERTDTLTGKKSYVPVEILLRKKSCVTGEPVVCLSINYDMLYEVPHDLVVRASADTNAYFLPRFEAYLGRAEKQFGSPGIYQLVNPMNFIHSSYRTLLLRGETDYIEPAPVSAILEFSKAGELGSTLLRDTLIAYTEYGEDSIVTDPFTGEQFMAYVVEVDTAYFVRKGFEEIVEHHILRYEPSSKSWVDFFNAVWLTKTLVPGELPYVVYRISTERPVSWHQSQSETQTLKTYYRDHNDPLMAYIERPLIQPFTRFAWEDQLLRHKLKYTLINENELFH